MNLKTAAFLKTVTFFAVLTASPIWWVPPTPALTKLTAYNPRVERHGGGMFPDGVTQTCLGENEFEAFMKHSGMNIHRCNDLNTVRDETLTQGNNRAEFLALQKVCRSAGALTCGGKLYGSATLLKVQTRKAKKCLAMMPSHFFLKGTKSPKSVSDCEFTGDYQQAKLPPESSCLLPSGSPVRKVSSGAHFALREAELAAHYNYAGADAELKDDVAVELDTEVCDNFDVPTYQEADLTTGLTENCDLITAGSVNYVEFLDYNITGTKNGKTVLASDFIPRFDPNAKSPIVEHRFTTGSGTSGFMNYCFDKTTNAVRPLIMQFAAKVRAGPASAEALDSNVGQLFLWDDALDVHWGISVWGMVNRSIVTPIY
jgi:hypothetical protein